MDPCASMLCSLLQFPAASAEDQIAFCGDRLPEHASDLLLHPDLPVDDDRSYAVYQVAQEGNDLLLLAHQFEEYWPIVSGRPENTLQEDETLLDEIQSLLSLMVGHQGNNQAYNRFWGKDALSTSHEWQLVRRLARLALTELRWPVTLPATPFVGLLNG